MDESAPPRAKQAKRSAPLTRLTAEERAIEQFPEDLYADGGVLFCRFCEHSVDFTRVDTVKDHLKSKKHCSRREEKRKQQQSGASSSRQQVTPSTVLKSKDLREGFILDYLKMCTVADIPLEKTESMRPFLQKHCKQAGALPQVTLRTTYVPRLYEAHFSALQKLLHDQQSASSQMKLLIYVTAVL